MESDNITSICISIILVTIILSITYYHTNKTPYKICLEECEGFHIGFHNNESRYIECIKECNNHFLTFNYNKTELVQSVNYSWNEISHTPYIYKICNGLIDKNCTQW